MRALVRKLGTLVARFRTRESGSAAVEFAFMAPILLTLYTGSVEVVQGLIINRQVGLVASTVANITAQYTTISAANDIPDILNAATQIVSPYSTTPLKVVVSSITINSSSKATVLWSKTKNGTARTAGSTITVPSTLLVPSSGLILAEVTYGYTPAVDYIKLGTITLSSATYMIPRDATLVNIGP
jgi:Flp pilus assembly protein TadG